VSIISASVAAVVAAFAVEEEDIRKEDETVDTYHYEDVPLYDASLITHHHHHCSQEEELE
jgi:hypothetical protein